MSGAYAFRLGPGVDSRDLLFSDVPPTWQMLHSKVRIQITTLACGLIHLDVSSAHGGLLNASSW